MAEPEWKQFEILVANIQKQLSPGSVVIHNDKILGRKSAVPRQIDVSIRGKVAQFDFLVIIDCKDYSNPVDVKDIEDFLGLIDDVGAQQGAMVSAKGYTEAARNRGTNAGIALYKLVDTDPHKWQAKVRAPMLCDFRGAKFSLSLSCSAPLPFRMLPDPNTWKLYNQKGEFLGVATELVRRKWNSGDVSNEVGEHRSIDYVGRPVQMDNGYGTPVPVKTTVDFLVYKRLLFGWISLEKIKGFKDEKDGSVITREFTTGPVDFETIEREWQQIASVDEAPAKPMLKLQATDCYGD